MNNLHKELEQLSPELWDVAVKGDSTVYAHVRTWQMGGMTYKEMLEKLAIALSKEKQSYFDMATDAINTRPPQPIYLDKFESAKEDK